jgi:hypothetical protein
MHPHRQTVKNAMISIVSQPQAVVSVETAPAGAVSSAGPAWSWSPAASPILDGANGGPPRNEIVS